MLPSRAGRRRRSSLLALAVTAALLAVPGTTQVATAAAGSVVTIVGQPGSDRRVMPARINCEEPFRVGSPDAPVVFRDARGTVLSGRRAIGYVPLHEPETATSRGQGVMVPFTDMGVLANLTSLREGVVKASTPVAGHAIVRYRDTSINDAGGNDWITGTTPINETANKVIDVADRQFTWVRHSANGPSVQNLGDATIAQFASGRVSTPMTSGSIGFIWGCEAQFTTTYFDDLAITSGGATTTYRFEGYSVGITAASTSSRCAISERRFTTAERFVTALTAPGYPDPPIAVRVSGPGHSSTQRLAPGRRTLTLPVTRSGPVAFTVPSTSSTVGSTARTVVHQHAAIAVRRTGPARVYVGQALTMSGRVTPMGRYRLKVLLAKPKGKKWAAYRAVRTIQTDPRGRFRVSVPAPRAAPLALSVMTVGTARLTSTAAAYGSVFQAVPKPQPQAPPPSTPPPSGPRPVPSPTPPPIPPSDDGGGGLGRVASPGLSARATPCGWKPAGRPGARAWVLSKSPVAARRG